LFSVDDAADQRRETRRRLLIWQQVELASLDIGNARSEAEAKEVAEAEHVICCATSVGVVLLNCQSRIVIEKPVEDVRRLARGCRDHLGIERPELVGDVGIERDAGLVAMARIHVCDSSTSSASTEVLPVR
jgi:hypothetical protein